MSVQRIQDGLVNCCQGIKEVGVASAQWGMRTCQAGFQYACQLASRIAEWIQPFFESAKQFVQENPSTIMVAVGAAAVGSILTALFSRLCCQDAAQADHARARRA